MTNNRDGVSFFVESMQAGNICPVCQEPLRVNDHATQCADCNTMHHARCFGRGGCASYHCRGETAAAQTGPLVPDLVLTKTEVASVVVPPSGRQHSTASLAAAIAPTEQRTSILAILSMLASFGCFAIALFFATGIGGVSTAHHFMFLGVLMGATLSIILGVFALANIQRSAHLKGNIAGLVGVLVSGLSIMLALYGLTARTAEERMAPVDFEPGKIKDFISHADQRIRTPLMANVHIAVTHGFAGESQGSGIVLTSLPDAAYVLSNVHVVTAGRAVKDIEALRKGPRIKVTFYTGDTYTGEPQWLAPHGIDLVLLKVKTPKPLSVNTKLQQGRLLAIGQKVFAIGNPVGLNWSYTEGVVSGMRSHQYGPHDLTVIQMQTPLNPGNSGGGLYDLDGFLVGVNTWIYSKSQTEGLNFSLAVDGLFRVIDPALLKQMALAGVTSGLTAPAPLTPETPTSPMSPTNSTSGSGSGSAENPGSASPPAENTPGEKPDVGSTQAPDGGL